MVLLAIDTSAGSGAAIVHDGAVLAVAEREDTRSHAEVIGVLVSGVLSAAGVEPRALDGVVAGMGPGPFTGLRVGIAAARALARAAHVPLHPIVSHDAVALDAARPCLVITDARRRESAWSAYGPPVDGLPARTGGPALARTDELDTALGAHAALERIAAPRIPVGALGLLGERLLASARPTGPAEPLYLRAPDVTPSPGPKRVTA